MYNDWYTVFSYKVIPELIVVAGKGVTTIVGVFVGVFVGVGVFVNVGVLVEVGILV